MRTLWVIYCMVTVHPSATSAARWRRIGVDHNNMGKIPGWGRREAAALLTRIYGTRKFQKNGCGR